MSTQDSLSILQTEVEEVTKELKVEVSRRVENQEKVDLLDHGYKTFR